MFRFALKLMLQYILSRISKLVCLKQFSQTELRKGCCFWFILTFAPSLPCYVTRLNEISHVHRGQGENKCEKQVKQKSCGFSSLSLPVFVVTSGTTPLALGVDAVDRLKVKLACGLASKGSLDESHNYSCWEGFRFAQQSSGAVTTVLQLCSASEKWGGLDQKQFLFFIESPFLFYLFGKSRESVQCCWGAGSKVSR